MNFLADYGLFSLKTITLVIAFLAILLPLLCFGRREKHEKGKLEIIHLNEKYEENFNKLKRAILTKEELKKFLKLQKQTQKEQAKKSGTKKKIFVLKFEGDIKASDTPALTEAINVVLKVAKPQDEVLLRLESHGGMVHAYGLAASQLNRIREAGIPLVISVDKVAASGGYLMACVANKILAAPFAILGSIGVIAQLPNFHRLMKKNDIDYEQITAGEFKRTLTLFGKNTEEGRQKFQEEVNEIHELFKGFIQKHRPQIEIEKVATGEHWAAEQAMALQLVDELVTSEGYLFSQLNIADLYEVNYAVKKSLTEKLSIFSQILVDRLIQVFTQKNSEKNLI